MRVALRRRPLAAVTADFRAPAARRGRLVADDDAARPRRLRNKWDWYGFGSADSSSFCEAFTGVGIERRRSRGVRRLRGVAHRPVRRVPRLAVSALPSTLTWARATSSCPPTMLASGWCSAPPRAPRCGARIPGRTPRDCPGGGRSGSSPPRTLRCGCASSARRPRGGHRPRASSPARPVDPRAALRRAPTVGGSAPRPTPCASGCRRRRGSSGSAPGFRRATRRWATLRRVPRSSRIPPADGGARRRRPAGGASRSRSRAGTRRAPGVGRLYFRDWFHPSASVEEAASRTAGPFLRYAAAGNYTRTLSRIALQNSRRPGRGLASAAVCDCRAATRHRAGDDKNDG